MEPRPHDEASTARRTAILAFAFLTAGSLSLAFEGVDLATLQRAFPLYALGGLSTLIFGTSRLLIAGMAGRDIAGGRTSALVTAALSATGALALYLTQAGPTPARAASAALWSLAAVAHVVIISLTVRRPATRAPIADPTASKRSRIPIRVLEAGSLLYAATSAILLPLAYADLVTRAAAIHAVLVGFVFTTIMGTAAHLLPRFTRARIPTSLLALLAPLAIAGPALMILGLHNVRPLLPWGAAIEGAAFTVFALAILSTLLRAHRMVRPPNLAYAAAPFLIGISGLIALSFAVRGTPADQLATHGLLAVFGSVGLIVIGASTDLYAPALEAGAAPAKRHAMVAILLLTSALAISGIGTWRAIPGAARAGMLLYAVVLGWQLVGILASHRRAGRVIARFRAP